MPRRRAKDYVEVLKAVKALMMSVGHDDTVSLPVVEVISDFEAALWKAVKDVFPNVRYSGCNFR